MRKKGNVESYFSKNLSKVSFYSWIIKLIPIPIGIISAKLMSIIIEFAIDGKMTDVIRIACIFLVINIGLILFNMIAGIHFEKVVSKAIHKCKIMMYNKFLSSSLDMLYLSERGELIESINDDFNVITNIPLSLYPDFYIGIITMLSYFVFIFSQNPFVALLLIIISFVQIISPIIIKKYMKINYDKARDIEAKTTDYFIEGYKGIATIKLYNLKRWYLKKMEKIHKDYLQIGSTAEITMASQNAMESFIEILLKYGTYGIIGLLALFKFTTVSIGIQAIALAPGLFGAIKTIFNLIPSFSIAKSAEKRLEKWFKPNVSNSLEIKDSNINFCNVSFSYNDTNILNNTNITINYEKINLIKGANGIGKSTFLKLITGLIKCTKGKIEVGKISPENINENVWSKQIFYLPQDDAVFHITAYELFNMIICKQVNLAVEYCFDFGLTYKNIYDTLVSDLSGGERKKIFLSLAFAIDPQILLLDEPTNSLDDHGKQILHKKLKNRKNGAVIISHDNIFNDIASDIYVFKNGGIFHE